MTSSCVATEHALGPKALFALLTNSSFAVQLLNRQIMAGVTSSKLVISLAAEPS